MAVFAGINSTADVGIVTSVSATKVKVRVSQSENQAISGVTFYVDFTLGTVTTYTLTATIIDTSIHATNEYQMPLLSSGSLSALSMTLSDTGKWVWPIATPLNTTCDIVLTASSTGSAADSTTIVLIEANRDTPTGR